MHALTFHLLYAGHLQSTSKFSVSHRRRNYRYRHFTDGVGTISTVILQVTKTWHFENTQAGNDRGRAETQIQLDLKATSPYNFQKPHCIRTTNPGFLQELFPWGDVNKYQLPSNRTSVKHQCTTPLTPSLRNQRTYWDYLQSMCEWVKLYFYEHRWPQSNPTMRRCVARVPLQLTSYGLCNLAPPETRRLNDLQLDGRHRRGGLRSGQGPMTLPTSSFGEVTLAVNRPNLQVL